MTANLPARMDARKRRWCAVFTVAILAATPAGCALLRPPPPPPPPPPVAEFAFEPDTVWTARPDVAIVGDSATAAIARVFTALHVLDADSTGIRVSCGSCRVTTGRVDHGDVVHTPTTPLLAASSSIAEFALAVRAAAEARDIDALAAVMDDQFTFSMVGLQGAVRAIEAWRGDGFARLGDVPPLLDRGLEPITGGVWAAPPEFAASPGYQMTRIGFRRSGSGEWRWVFLVRGLSANGG